MKLHAISLVRSLLKEGKDGAVKEITIQLLVMKGCFLDQTMTSTLFSVLFNQKEARLDS